MQVELRYFFCAHCLIVFYICIKFCQSISKGFRVTDPDSRSMIGWSQMLTDGHTDKRMDIQMDEQMENWIPILQNDKNFSQDNVAPGKDHVTMKFTKGHNSVKSVGEVKVLVLCTLSDNALYLYQVLPKCFKGFQSYRPGQLGLHLTDGRMKDEQMDEKMENRIPILCRA